MHPRRTPAAFDRSMVGHQFGLHRDAPLVQCFAKQAQLIEFLHRKRQPRDDFAVHCLFARQIDRHMQQRARRGNPQAILQLTVDRLKPFEGCVQIGFPDVAAIDDAQRQHLMRRQAVDDLRDFRTGVDGIEMQSIHR